MNLWMVKIIWKCMPHSLLKLRKNAKKTLSNRLADTEIEYFSSFVDCSKNALWFILVSTKKIKWNRSSRKTTCHRQIRYGQTGKNCYHGKHFICRAYLVDAIDVVKDYLDWHLMAPWINLSRNNSSEIKYLNFVWADE